MAIFKLNSYRIIRFSETPESMDVHFVKNEINPTGVGAPPYAPLIGALANALNKVTGKRHYHQPYSKDA